MSSIPEVTINVYTQVLDASPRTVVDRIVGELFTSKAISEASSEPVVSAERP